MEGFYIIAIAPSLNAWLLQMFPLHLSLLKYLLNDVKKACIWNFRVNDSQTRCLVNRFGIPVGGYFRDFWVGVCRWDPGTLNLYQN